MFLSKIKNAVTLLCCSLFAVGFTAFVHAQQEALQDKAQAEAKKTEKESSNIKNKNKNKKQNANNNAQKKPSNERFIPSEEISEDSPIAFPVDI